MFRHSINSFGFKIHRFNNEVIILVVDFLNFHPLSSLKYILRVKKNIDFWGKELSQLENTQTVVLQQEDGKKIYLDLNVSTDTTAIESDVC